MLRWPPIIAALLPAAIALKEPAPMKELATFDLTKLPDPAEMALLSPALWFVLLWAKSEKGRMKTALRAMAVADGVDRHMKLKNYCKKRNLQVGRIAEFQKPLKSQETSCEP